MKIRIKILLLKEQKILSVTCKLHNGTHTQTAQLCLKGSTCHFLKVTLIIEQQFHIHFAMRKTDFF